MGAVLRALPVLRWLLLRFHDLNRSGPDGATDSPFLGLGAPQVALVQEPMSPPIDRHLQTSVAGHLLKHIKFKINLMFTRDLEDLTFNSISKVQGHMTCQICVGPRNSVPKAIHKLRLLYKTCCALIDGSNFTFDPKL